MKFKAEIDVMPLEALLDPQGKAVTNSMPTIGLPEIVDAPSKEVATEKVELACKKLLSNQIMESYSYTVEEA